MSEVIENAPIAPEEASNEPSPQEVAQDVAKRLYKVKINGNEQEVDEQELLAGYSTRKAADEKFREAAMTRKQAEEFISLLKTDPLKVLNNPNLGINFKELAEKFLVEQYEDDMLDPRDRELREAKRQLAEIEEQKKEQQKQQEEAQATELRERYTNDYVKNITDALSTSGLPKTEHTVKRMAYYMAEGLKRGMDLQAKDVISLVKDDYMTEHKSFFSNLDGDALLQILGDDVATKIRKHDISKLKSPVKPLSTPEKQAEPIKREASQPKMSKDEWKKRLAEISRS
jgi:hypothetical protein